MLVQFKNSTKEEIIAYFGGPQDPEYFPNQGEIEADDPMWAVFYDKVHMWLDGLPEPITIAE
ncbi:hypothetical protein V1951_17125 [Yersinia sp. 2544 StPb PI]|uniref:hypothetical protein n=1 Tax=Yersinia TaxID=629 RepID=UPI0005DD0171|nr:MULTISPECIES: hypothetical protein [Yersinia]ARB84512.1 hypothetical protein A6J67_11140 [Yersinia sp. FDAARGOS_228]AVL34290.1 hypothetical protein CEQ36_00745 [Yersinia intermedia]CND27949.1 Uncharacterised protein [Yersinia intermedia]